MADFQRRLDRLEGAFRTQEQEAEEAAEGLQAIRTAWDRLAGTMAPEYVRHVLEEWAREPTVTEPRSRLTRVVEDLITWPPPDHLLTLPPEVAQVYLDDRAAHPIADCEDCGYSVPMRPEWWQGGTPMTHFPAVSYFPHCPLCGGHTGVRAYYRKHGEMP